MGSSLMTQCVNGTYVVLFYNNWALRVVFTTSLTHPVRHTFMQALFLYLGTLSNICTQTDASGATQGSMSCQRIHQHAEWGIQAINLPVDRQPTLLPDLLSHSLLFEENFAKKYDDNLVCTFFFTVHQVTISLKRKCWIHDDQTYYICRESVNINGHTAVSFLIFKESENEVR